MGMNFKNSLYVVESGKDIAFLLNDIAYGIFVKWSGERIKLNWNFSFLSVQLH